MSWRSARQILYVGCQGDRASLEVAGYPAEPVTFHSADDSVRRGWYTPGSKYPEVAIIVLPGHAGNSSAAIPDAAILAEEGFSTLVYEHRTCADPKLSASTGYHESYDVIGAAQYLIARGDVEHVGAIGESEGGTASLLAAAEEMSIEAVISMGGYTSLADDVLDPQIEKPWVGTLFRQMLLRILYWQIGGVDPERMPKHIIADISPRPVLLIYGEFESADGEIMHAAAEEPVSLWIVPGAGHAGYRNYQPAEYRNKITDFFKQAFGINSTD